MYILYYINVIMSILILDRLAVNPFVALLTSLPAGNSTLRMRAWRSLKVSGCAILRDGVHILPAEAPRAESLLETESEIKAAGGFAMIVELDFKTAAQADYARKLFDRSREYGELVAKTGAARATVRRLGKRKAHTLVQRLRRSLDELHGIDFYPGQAKMQAGEAMAALEAEAERLFSGGEPQASKKKILRLDASKYRNRTWATRKDLWVDRLACAWLIRRFIDRNAKFFWFDRPRSRPKGAIGFDFDGAQFTHVDGRVTFEVIASSFGLDRDQALASLGQAVHFLDIGGIPVADAKGLETLLKGIKAKARSDDETFAEANKVFDLFYSAYAQEKAD